MANLPQQFNVNARNWQTESGSFVPPQYHKFWYYNHPDYDGVIAVIGDGSNTFDDLTILAAPLQGGVYLTEDRIALNELTTTGLTVDGWYTIAELPVASYTIGVAMFQVTVKGSTRHASALVAVNFNSTPLAKTHENTTVEILGTSVWNVNPILGFRIAKSDTSETAGAKLQVNLDISINVNVIVQKALGTSDLSQTGWELVSATQTDNDKTPDGSAASFLVAGEEYRLTMPGTGSVFFSDIKARYISNNAIDVMVDFGEIIYPNVSAIALTLPTTFGVYDGAANTTAPTGGTYTQITRNNDHTLSFRWTETNIGLGLNAGPLGFLGSGGSFVITLS